MLSTHFAAKHSNNNYATAGYPLEKRVSRESTDPTLLGNLFEVRQNPTTNQYYFVLRAPLLIEPCNSPSNNPLPSLMVNGAHDPNQPVMTVSDTANDLTKPQKPTASIFVWNQKAKQLQRVNLLA